MNVLPAGLAPVEGIPMRAQAILHREILRVHALLTLTTLLLRTRLAILSPTFLDYITSPHLQVQVAMPGTFGSRPFSLRSSRDARNLRFASFLAPFESRCQEPSLRVVSRSVRVAMPGTFGSRPFSLRSSRDARNLRLASFLALSESRCQEPSGRVLSRSVRVAMPGTFGSRPFSLRSSRDARNLRCYLPTPTTSDSLSNLP